MNQKHIDAQNKVDATTKAYRKADDKSGLAIALLTSAQAYGLKAAIAVNRARAALDKADKLLDMRNKKSNAQDRKTQRACIAMNKAKAELAKLDNAET